MSFKMTEGEFHSLGLSIDPTDSSKAVHITALCEAMPDDSWNLDRLARYATSGLAEAARLDHEAIQIGRRSTVQIFRSGRALSIARQRLKAEGWGRWGRWLEEHGIKRTSAWEAAELFERAKSEAQVHKLTLSEAKIRFGITKTPNEEEDTPVDHRLNSTPSTSTESVLTQGDVEKDGDGDHRPPEGPVPYDSTYEPDRLAHPPRTVREMLSAAFSLLAECHRRRVEIDSTCLSLIAEVVEIAAHLSTESPS